MANFAGITAKGPPAAQPRFLFFIKIAIIVLSLIVLALAAYAISVFGSLAGYYGSTGASGLLIFVVIKTWIIYGAFLFIEMKAPHLFYRIIALVLYGISLIFWLSAWAYAASTAAYYLSWSSSYGGILYGTGYDNWFKREGGALAGCAAIGALVWVLSIVHFVFFIRSCMADTTSTGAELGNVQHKQEASAAPAPAAAPVQYQTQPTYQQPQQTYPQQAYPQQQTYPTQ